ncbi:MAG: GAF domain-containing protein [Bacteroidia bacterium]
MAESLLLSPTATKAERYQELIPQIKALIEDEQDLVANMANISAVLKMAFDFFWVGFYIQKDGELVLGPFQGPLACTRIAFDRGVCGAAAKTQQSILVPDVEKFPGHIACSSASRSEVVIPLVTDGTTRFVLDVDSDRFNDFDQDDVKGLEAIVDLLRFHFA